MPAEFFDLAASDGPRSTRARLLDLLQARLEEEELEFADLPDSGSSAFGDVLAELGFASALEHIKLRKLVSELQAQGGLLVTEDYGPVPVGQRQSLEPSVRARSTRRERPAGKRSLASKQGSSRRQEHLTQKLQALFADGELPLLDARVEVSRVGVPEQVDDEVIVEHVPMHTKEHLGWRVSWVDPQDAATKRRRDHLSNILDRLPAAIGKLPDAPRHRAEADLKAADAAKAARRRCRTAAERAAAAAADTADRT